MQVIMALFPLSLSLGGLVSAAPAFDLTATACELRLASGDHAVARSACPGLADWASLAAADQAEAAALASKPSPVKGKTPPPDPWIPAFEAVERARQAHPDGVVEEAWSVALMAQRGATPPPPLPPADAKPKKVKGAPPIPVLLRWPMSGTRIPLPALPPLNDETIRQANDSLQRATERLRSMRGRLTIEAPESLRQAVERGVAERRLLLEKLAAALEDALEKDPKFTKVAWLHLAATYLELDRGKPGAERVARGVAMLRRLREKAPQDSAAALAGLWMAGFALDRGDAQEVRTLVEEGALLDPALGGLYDAILAFARGDLPAARTALLPALKHPDPGARAQALALDALLRDPKAAETAQAWENCAAALDEAEEVTAAPRARLRAGIAWTGAARTGLDFSRIPPDQRRAVLRLLVQADEIPKAIAHLAAALEADPTSKTLAADGVAVFDVLAGSSLEADQAAADPLLADLSRRLIGEGPFAKAHAKTPVGAAFTDALRTRLMERVSAPLASGRPLDEAARARLGPLVEARLTLFPPGAADEIPTARALALAGFGDRAATIARKVRDSDADQGRRLEAAGALVELTLARAREAGLAGEPVGAFLDGPTARMPMPATVRALVDAQTALLEMLRPGKPRDVIFCDHVAIRAGFGQADELADELQKVIARHEHDALGLRAALLVMQRGTPDSRARDAIILVRKRVGPAERETALRTFVGKAAKPLETLTDGTTIAQRLFDRSAMAYEAVAAKATVPVLRDASRAAAAGAWAMALRVPEATRAFRDFLKDAPEHALAGEARAFLATLLLDAGNRPEAAAVFEEIAQKDSSRAGDALASLRALYSTAPARLRPVLERLVKEFPGKVPDAPELLARLTPPASNAHTPRAPAQPGRFFARGLR